MQPTLRAVVRPARQTVAVIRRSIHSSSSSSNPAVLLTESRHSAEPFRQNNEFISAHTRAISYGRPTNSLSSASTKFPPLGPRGQANFTSSIARQDLGFLPIESSIIFPTFEAYSTSKDRHSEIRVPFLPDNFNPERAPEPEVVVTKPIIATVADAITHIAAPSAIMEGFSVSLSFVREPEAQEDVEAGMMRAFRM